MIVWNYKERTIKGSYETHKVGIEDLCFTCNSDFLVSLGGRDDGNIVVWDMRNNLPICGISCTTSDISLSFYFFSARKESSIKKLLYIQVLYNK